MIEGVAGLAEAQPGDLSFFSNRRYRRDFESTRASAVLVDDGTKALNGMTLVKVQNPHLAFARLSQVFFPKREYTPGIAPGAHVHPEAKVHASATVMAGAA